MPETQSGTASAEPASRKSITLVLPAWNEAEVIDEAIAEAHAALSALTSDYEILVVDDGSSDATAELTQRAAESDSRVRLIQHGQNRGYGAALRTGFEAARCDLVVFTDTDCQFDLTELDRFVLLSNHYDIVCGYRIDRKDTPLRCLYSRVYNQIVRGLLGMTVRDIDCALKMFHRDVLADLKITTDGFLVNTEMLTQARQQGKSVVEVGVSHRPRAGGESTVSVHHIPKVFKSLLRYWWNAGQFPKSRATQLESERSTDSQTRWYQLAVLVMAAVFILSNLGFPLIDRDETRYAEIPREMLATGNWVLPHLNFEPYYDKPPMLYWLCAASYTIFGVSEWSARLVPGLAALLTIAATMWFGSRWFHPRVGLYGGIVLTLSVGFAFCSRYLLMDGVLTALVALSLFSAYEAVRTSSVQWNWWILSAVCCGLACLVKGPLVFVLWLPPVFVFTWISQSNARPKLVHFAALFGIAFAIAAPWFLLVHLRDPDFLYEFFVNHNIRRFGGGFHARPIWYLVPIFLVASMPWSFLTFSVTRFLFSRDNEIRANRPPALGYLVLWAGWAFLFFSLSKCKLPTYLLPTAPAFALIVGHYLYVIFDRSDRKAFHFARFWAARMATVTTCVAAIGFLVYAMVTGLPSSPATYMWCFVWIAVLLATVIMRNDDGPPQFAWMSSAAVAGLLCTMVLHQLVPAYSRSQTVLGDGSPIATNLRDSADVPVATLGHEFSEIPFYLRRSNVFNRVDVDPETLSQFVQSNPESLIVTDREITTEQLRDQVGGAKVELIGERGPALVHRVTMSGPEQRIGERTQHETRNSTRR